MKCLRNEIFRISNKHELQACITCPVVRYKTNFLNFIPNELFKVI